MHRKSFLTTFLLIGSLANDGQSQERTLPTVSLRKGHTLSKTLARMPNDAQPLLLQIEVPRQDVVAGENFPLRYTITNPNSTALRLSVAGRYHPPLYAAIGDEELTLFVQESFDLEVGGRAIVLASGESMTMTYTVFPYLDSVVPILHAQRGYTLRLLGAGVVEATAIDQTGCPKVMCKWEAGELKVPVRAPTAHERQAYQTLLDWTEGQEQAHADIVAGNRARGVPDSVSREEWTLAMVDFRRRFLEEYGDTPYANQVRLNLLRNLVELPRQHPINGQATREPLFSLYVKTVFELLDAGAPYASNVDREVLETFGMARRWDLLVAVVDKLLATNSSERTLDRTLVSVSKEFVDFPRLQAKGYLSPGKETEDLRAVAVRCIERCSGWTAYRAPILDHRTFGFLSAIERWDILELAAQRTLDAARQGENCGAGPPLRHSEVDDGLIADATEALNLARREQGKE